MNKKQPETGKQRQSATTHSFHCPVSKESFITSQVNESQIAVISKMIGLIIHCRSFQSIVKKQHTQLIRSNNSRDKIIMNGAHRLTMGQRIQSHHQSPTMSSMSHQIVLEKKRTICTSNLNLNHDEKQCLQVKKSMPGYRPSSLLHYISSSNSSKAKFSTSTDLLKQTHKSSSTFTVLTGRKKRKLKLGKKRKAILSQRSKKKKNQQLASTTTTKDDEYEDDYERELYEDELIEDKRTVTELLFNKTPEKPPGWDNERSEKWARIRSKSFSDWIDVFRKTKEAYLATFETDEEKAANAVAAAARAKDGEDNAKANDDENSIIQNTTDIQKDLQSNFQSNVSELRKELPGIIKDVTRDKDGKLRYTKEDAMNVAKEFMEVATKSINQFMQGYRTAKEVEIDKTLNQYFQELGDIEGSGETNKEKEGGMKKLKSKTRRKVKRLRSY